MRYVLIPISQGHFKNILGHMPIRQLNSTMPLFFPGTSMVIHQATGPHDPAKMTWRTYFPDCFVSGIPTGNCWCIISITNCALKNQTFSSIHSTTMKSTIRMSSSCLQMICLIVILMNVLTAFAGIYEQSRPDEQDVLHLDHSQVIPHHRGLQSESIDYSGCYADLSNADENNNGFIEQQEYYTFLKSYGKRVCYSGATVTVQQKSTFYTLACLCRQIGNDGSLENQAVTDSDACCLGNNAKIYTYRDPVTLEPIPVPLLTVSQKEYVKTVCFYADASIPASARDCSTNTTDEDEGEDMTCNSNPSISAQTPLPPNETSWQVYMNPIPQDGRFKQTLPHYEEVSVKKSTKNLKKGGYFTWSPTRQQNLMNRLMPTAFSPRLLRRSPQVISRGTTT